MTFAPLLMLRKRSGQTLHAALQKTLSQLESGIQIPLGIREICGESRTQCGTEEGEHDRHPCTIPDEVLFPLPTNDEQRNIVYRLDGRPGILVQGPPGTGKRHPHGAPNDQRSSVGQVGADQPRIDHSVPTETSLP